MARTIATTAYAVQVMTRSGSAPTLWRNPVQLYMSQ